MPPAIGALATPGGGGHVAHLVLAACWLAVVGGGLLVGGSASRSGRRRSGRRTNRAAPRRHVPAAAAARNLMATWPPHRALPAGPAPLRRAAVVSGHGPAGGAVAVAWPLPLAALGLLVAAAVHAAVMPEHLRESALYGAFFASVLTGQLALAVAIRLRPSRRLLRAVGAASVAVAVLWLYTRVVGVPVGPGAGRTEAVGWPDALATAAELVTALGCVLAGRRRLAGD
ncbi:MAG TPA: hypothetical protein VFH45_12395 [Acidimicrobiales bacterium]|nr:hypothetical protein [Acidimicrobiales bacterium]